MYTRDPRWDMKNAATLRHVPGAWILTATVALTLGCGSSNKSASSGADGSLDNSSGGYSSGATNGSSGGSLDDGSSSGSSDAGPAGSSSGSDDGGPGDSSGGGADGSSGSSSGGSSDANSSSDVGAETGSTPTLDSGTKADGGTKPDSGSSTACVPTIPTVAWTSPYAGWTRGIPTDPTFFPIAVWLQLPSHAMELAGIGVNIYLGNNGGTDPLMPSDLATLKSLGMYAIIGQDSTGLASIDDTTVIGWWMTPDEPDNAQPASGGGYGPPVAPSTLITQYNAYKKADPTRPIYLGLGQGVAYPDYEGRGSNPPPESQYVPASDIIAFDIYPYNNCSGDANEVVTCGEFWLNATGVESLHGWATRNQAVWTDFETTVIAADTTDGPTPVETASEVWLALIHGANGVIYFIDSWNPSFREDAIFENTAMVTAVTALNAQITSLAPELNSANLPGMVTVTTAGDASAPVDVMV